MNDRLAETDQFISDTWKECGVRAVRPLRNMVFVRTEPHPEYIGSIFIPPSLRTVYGRFPHKIMLNALVIGTGPKCQYVKVGDRVAFSRLFFARWQQVEDRTLVGWAIEDNLAVALDNGIKIQQQGDYVQTPSGERASRR